MKRLALLLCVCALTGCRYAGNKEIHITVQPPPGQLVGTAQGAALPQVKGQAAPSASGTGAVVINIVDSSDATQDAGKTLDNVGNPKTSLPVTP